MNITHAITVRDFSKIFGQMTERLARKIRDANLEYQELSSEERDLCLLQIIQGLLGSQFEVAGEHRRERWEKGWTRNLDALKTETAGSITPFYFQKDQIARWQRQLVKPTKPGFDRNGLAIIMEWLFEKYISHAPAVYEFGCGTGHHLLQLREVNPKAALTGLDWTETSQQIIRELVRQGKISGLTGRNFDFFNPDQTLTLEEDAVVYTVGALEQVGDRHTAFIDYLLEQKPTRVIHVEPISEMLDRDHLLDYLAIEYFEKRNYLRGLLPRLEQLEREGKLHLEDVRRTFLGGNMYVDHYSVIVWSPC